MSAAPQTPVPLPEISVASNANCRSPLTLQIVFLTLTVVGVVIPLCMADPNKMIRSDGTKVTSPQHPSWKTEFWGLWVALKTDPYIILLFPMFFASNWFYTWREYHTILHFKSFPFCILMCTGSLTHRLHDVFFVTEFNDYNGALFNIRTRSLNNLVYWLSQIIGSVSIGFLLDQRALSRRLRAFCGWWVLLVMVFLVHIWAYFYQRYVCLHPYLGTAHVSLIPLLCRDYTRESLLNTPKIDIFDSSYPPRIVLYICCGLLDSMWQTCAYWFMGAMSNDPAKLAHFTGFCTSLSLSLFCSVQCALVSPFPPSLRDPSLFLVWVARPCFHSFSHSKLPLALLLLTRPIPTPHLHTFTVPEASYYLREPLNHPLPRSTVTTGESGSGSGAIIRFTRRAR